MDTLHASPLRGPASEVLALLCNRTYEEVSSATGLSRGAIWRIAKEAGARKHELRIRARAEDRRRLQEDCLREMIGGTAKMDVLDFLEGVPDESVDLVVTSPPYNLGKAYGGSPAADQMRFVYFHGWLQMVVSELARVLKPGGTLFLQVGATRDWTPRQGLLPLDVLLFEDVRRAGLDFQSRVVWTFEHGLTPKARLSERYETALVCSKGDPAVFNPTPARTPQKQPGKRAFKGPRRGSLSGHPFGAHPSNVWRLTHVKANSPDRAHGAHPAQFPLALARRAVLLYSMPGQLVLDAFAGAGTTQVACVETGRDFLGADLFYEDLRARRLAATVPDNVSWLPGVTDESLAVWQAEARRVEARGRPVSAAQNRALMAELFETDVAQPEAS